MSNQKLKAEHYSNFAGINSKVSPYSNNQLEFLNLVNYDFQTPGALTQRWGSTMYVGQTFAGPVTSLYEFARLDGTSQIIIGHTGGLWAGATTGNSQGLSFTQQALGWQPHTSADASAGWPNGWQGLVLYTGKILSSFPNFTQRFCFAYLGISTLNFETACSIVVTPFTQSDNVTSFVTFQNYLFAADGNKFWKYDGATTYNVGLPYPVPYDGKFYTCGLTSPGGVTAVVNTIDSSNYFIGTSTGWYSYYVSYVNNRGFEGPVAPIGVLNTAFNGVTLNGNLISANNGGTYITGYFDVNVPLGYGISSINIYTYWATTSPFATLNPGTAIGNGNDSNIALANFWNQPAAFLRNEALNGTTLHKMYLGSTLGDFSNAWSNLQSNGGALPSTSYAPRGITYSSQNGFLSVFNYTAYFPRYLEVYQNRLFSAGYSTTPSVVWFSDTLEPEGYQSDFNFEVRTDDGDVVTALKAYSTRLYVFKSRSFYALYGDNPSNFYLQELSLQYGAVNHRSVVVYENVLLFLDRKGVIVWNGAQIDVLSKPVQPIFDTMNLSAAPSVACMVHDKIRNQIIVAIPTGNSTVNNTFLVYDYVVGQWTKYDNLNIASMHKAFGRNLTENVFFGNFSGSVNWMGSSFTSDNGQGFTLVMKPAFLKPLGDSTQEQFRRLYMDANYSGTTLPFNINFYQDYGSSVVYQTSLVISQFQQRIDFGISAKSLTFEASIISQVAPLKVFGFTIESRLQRRV